MKNSIFVISFFLWFGCSTVNGVVVKQEVKNCFSREEVKNLLVQTNSEASHLFIQPIVVDKKRCIGLYGYIFKDLTTSGRVVHKALKFENMVYYRSEDEGSNKTALNEFTAKYKNVFEQEEMAKLTNSFKNGTELNANLY